MLLLGACVEESIRDVNSHLTVVEDIREIRPGLHPQIERQLQTTDGRGL